MMRTLKFLLFFTLLFPLILVAQKDSVKIKLIIDDETIKFSNDLLVSIKTDSIYLSNNIIDSLIIIEPKKLNGRFVIFTFKYKKISFTINKLSNSFKAYNADIVILTKKFSRKFKRKKILFEYFIRFTPRFSYEELANMPVGQLHANFVTTRKFVFDR